MRHARFIPAFAALLLLAASPAWAVKEWYAHYDDGRRALARGRLQEAIGSFREARKLRPRSELQVQTYGLNFIDYLPHYYEGLCHLKLGDFSAAAQQFEQEERQQAIRKSPLYMELQRLQQEAREKVREQDAEDERQQRARRARKLEAALARLMQAQKLAELLDPETQRQVAERVEKIQAEWAARQEQAARAEKVEDGLASGRRLLEQGQYAEAKLHFDDVLGLAPDNAAAREGRRRAEEGILARTTQQQRQRLLEEGRTLYEAGRYQQALRPLSEAAADPENTEANELLAVLRGTLDRLQKQKELHARVAQLLADGERQLEEGRHAEAMVTLRTVLQLDPTHVRARERLQFAERMTGHGIYERIFPNREPELAFAEEPASRVQSPTVALVGVASDDRGLVRIAYRQGGRLLEEQALTPGPDGDFPRAFRIERVFSLEAGDNEVSVAVTDTSGSSRVERFPVHRQLRFYETRAFVPSAAGTALGLVGLGLAGQRLRRRRAVRRRFNPYIAGAPVMDGDMFFGRRKLLARILNVLHHNSLMITGERRIGKTTFLYRLKSALETDEGTEYRFFPVFVDLQGVREDDFFHALMSDVVEALRPSPATLESLRYRPEEPELFDGRDFSHDLQRIVEELKARTPRKVKLALLIDEVDVLNQFSERVNQRLRSIFMKTFSEHLVAVMSGVGIRRTWNSEGSPWYNFFDEVELSAFTREEAEALVRQPVEGVFRFHPEAVERILELSALKPYVIQRYCVQAVNLMLEEGRSTITLRHVEQVRPVVQTDPEDERALGYLPRQASA